MKVLQINSVYGFGSTGRIVEEISKLLICNNSFCMSCYGRELGDKSLAYSNQAVNISNKVDNKIHAVYTRIFDRHGFTSTSSTNNLMKVITEFNPDIIHLHNLHGYYLNIELLFDFLKLYNKPVIWTLHDCWAFTGHCAHFDYIRCDRWKTGCYNCPQKKEYPASYLIDGSSKNYKRKKELFTSVKDMTIVTPSFWLASLVGESFLHNYPMEVINNGIDLDVFKPRESFKREEYGLKNKFIILGVASVWGRKKGLDAFIKLSQILGEEYQVILVGLSEKQKRKLPKNVMGITRTNNVEELVELYSIADVFINPTLEDTFPTTNLEALACGTAVITYDTGGSPECIDDKCGVVVEKDNMEQLLHVIKEAKDKLINSEACIDRSRSFNKKDRYNDYMNLYTRIISRG